MRDAVPLRSEIRGSCRNDFRKRNRPRPLALQFGPARFRSRAGRRGSVASRSLEPDGPRSLKRRLLINQAAACSGRWSRQHRRPILIQRGPAVPSWHFLSAAWNPAAIGGIADWVHRFIQLGVIQLGRRLARPRQMPRLGSMARPRTLEPVAKHYRIAWTGSWLSGNASAGLRGWPQIIPAAVAGPKSLVNRLCPAEGV